MARGLVHIYCGDGKGKTTASIGLSLRAAGAGLRVLYVQFFKDGSSSEFRLLEQAGVTFLRPAKKFGFYRTLTPQQREEARAFYTEHFRTAAAMAGDFDLLVLDEAMSACRTGVVPEEEVLAFLQSRPERLEVVLTGRDPSQALFDAADYVTEMCKRKHPFDRGIPARRGIEF